MRGMLTFVLILAGGYLAFGALLYLRQAQYLYFPTPEIHALGMEALYLDSQDETLKLWSCNPGHPRAVVYFGGNAEQVAEIADCFLDRFPDYTLYLVNYRGYGGSTGKPSERGFDADGLNVFDYVNARHARVSVIGRSIGSAVATHVAARRPVDKTVLITPFDSIARLGQKQFPIYPVHWLLRDRFDSHIDAGDMTGDVLVISTRDDHIVPPDSTRRLIQALSGARLQTIELGNGGHNYIEDNPRYAAALAAFMNDQPVE